MGEEIIPIRNRRELEKKVLIKKDIEAALRALDVVLEGRGARGTAAQEQLKELQTIRNQIAAYKQYLMEKEYEESDLGEVYGALVGMRAVLMRYLSDEQQADFFGRS